MCVTADGPEKVTIMDVLYVNDKLYLIVKGQRDAPYVFEIMYNGLRSASREGSKEAMEAHETELMKMAAHAHG